MSRKKLLIFDIDGTLVNSGIDWNRIRRVFKESIGIDVDGKPLAEVLSSLPAGARESLERVVVEAERSSIMNVRADHELRNLVQAAKRRGYSVVVVSLRGRVTAFEVLRRLGIDDLVDIVVTREDTPRRDEQLARVLDLIGMDSSNAIFFGDTPWDEESARSLGLSFIRIAGDGRVGRTPESLLRKLREVLGSWR